LISFSALFLQLRIFSGYDCKTHFKRSYVGVSCNLGVLIVSVERLSRLILSCSNFTILFFKFSFWVDIICPLNNISFFLSLIIPFWAITVVEFLFDWSDVKFFNTLDLSWINTFSILLLFFFSTKKVNPLNESLNCWVLTVGKKESKFSLFNNNLDCCNAIGVIKVEKIKYKNKINIEITKKRLLMLIF